MKRERGEKEEREQERERRGRWGGQEAGGKWVKKGGGGILARHMN